MKMYPGDSDFWEVALTEAELVLLGNRDSIRLRLTLQELASDWVWQKSSGHPFAEEIVGSSVDQTIRGLRHLCYLANGDPVKFARRCRVIVGIEWLRHRRLYFAMMLHVEYGLWFMASLHAYRQNKRLHSWMVESTPPLKDSLRLSKVCVSVQRLLDDHEITMGWNKNWFFKFFGGDRNYAI